jgi:eukaryotic-like serine/threonine-protein kinase
VQNEFEMPWSDDAQDTLQDPMIPPSLVPEGYRVGRALGNRREPSVFALDPIGEGPRLAMKLVRRQPGSSHGRFDREVDVLGRIRHPNLVRLLDARHARGASALIMMRIEGVHLTPWLEASPRSHMDRIQVFRQLVGAVASLHDGGAIHRDLNPGNVLVREDPSAGPVACLIDLGIAKSSYLDGMTLQGATLGTPGFLAPEQIRDAGSVDHRADLFALGCLLHLLLAGEPPFQGPGPAAVLGAIALGHRRPILDAAPHTALWLADLTDKLLSPRPADRPERAQAIKEWLDRQGPPAEDTISWHDGH